MGLWMDIFSFPVSVLHNKQCDTTNQVPNFCTEPKCWCVEVQSSCTLCPELTEEAVFSVCLLWFLYWDLTFSQSQCHLAEACLFSSHQIFVILCGHLSPRLKGKPSSTALELCSCLLYAVSLEQGEDSLSAVITQSLIVCWQWFSPQQGASFIRLYTEIKAYHRWFFYFYYLKQSNSYIHLTSKLHVYYVTFFSLLDRQVL